MQKARRHPKGLRPLVSVWFQVLFHSPVRGTFHLSLTVLVHYRSLLSIQPYRMVPVDSDRISRVPPYSGYYQLINLFQIQGYHLLWLFFPKHSFINLKYILQSYNPKNAETYLVWAISISLATTKEITIVFSSSGYLDVSVHQVSFKLMINLLLIGLPHSEISGSKVICTYPKLIAACHVLHRLREPRHSPYALN